MGKLSIPDDGRPRAWVQVQIVPPKGSGQQVVTVQVELPVDHEIDDEAAGGSYGSGIEAMLDWATDTAKLELRTRRLRSVG